MNHLELARDWELALGNALSLITKEVSDVIMTDSGFKFWAFNGAIKILKKDFDFSEVHKTIKNLVSYSWKVEVSSAPRYLAELLELEGLKEYSVTFPAFVLDLNDKERKEIDTPDVNVTIEKVKNKDQFKKWEDYVAKRSDFTEEFKEVHSTLFWGAIQQDKISCYSAIGKDDGKVKATGALSFYKGAAYHSNGAFKKDSYGLVLDKELIKVAEKVAACAVVAVCKPYKTEYMEAMGYKEVTSYMYFKTVGE